MLESSLESLLELADRHHLIDEYHITEDRVIMRVGARDLEMCPDHALRFVQGLLEGFDRAMNQSAGGDNDGRSAR